MATDALAQQARKRSTARSPPNKSRKHIRKNQSSSLVSMIGRWRSMHAALTAIDRENNNNPNDLPFPIIRWEDEDECGEEDQAASLKHTRSRSKEQTRMTSHIHEKEKGTRCLRRSLSCREHLSLLALDQLVSMEEQKYRIKSRRLRIKSCPF